MFSSATPRCRPTIIVFFDLLGFLRSLGRTFHWNWLFSTLHRLPYSGPRSLPAAGSRVGSRRFGVAKVPNPWTGFVLFGRKAKNPWTGFVLLGRHKTRDGICAIWVASESKNVEKYQTRGRHLCCNVGSLVNRKCKTRGWENCGGIVDHTRTA